MKKMPSSTLARRSRVPGWRHAAAHPVLWDLRDIWAETPMSVDGRRWSAAVDAAAAAYRQGYRDAERATFRENEGL